MNPSAEKTVPLRKSLRVRVGLLVVGAVLLVAAGFLALALGPLAERVAATDFASASTRLEARLDLSLTPAANALEMAAGWLSDAPPRVDDLATFNRLFEPILKAQPKATSIVAGDSDGHGWMLLQLADGGWRNRLTDLPRWGQRHRFVDRDASGQVSEHWETLDYDPRRRSWYEAAMLGSGTRWTAPYTFYTTGDPGITATRRIKLDNERTLVIGIDLMLRDLSLTTMNEKVGRNGLALVLTDDLRALALPAAPPGTQTGEWLKHALQPHAALGLPILDRAVAEWQRKPDARVHRIAVDGTDWFARITDYPLGDSRLLLVTLAPSSDFSPDWLPAGSIVGGGLLFMLVLATWVVRQQARRIARPLEELATASSRIGQLDFATPPLPASPIQEIRQLANAHEEMRWLLQEKIAALHDAEEKIRDSEAYNKVLFLGSRIPLVVLDPQNGRFIDCNQAAADIYRLGQRENVIGLSVRDVSAPYQPDGTFSHLACEEKIRQVIERGPQVFEWRHRRPDGEHWDAEVHLMPFHHGDHLLLQFSLQDITDRKQAAQALEQLALYDPLTELPNRALFLDRLQQSIGQALRNDSRLAVLFLDLDRFKEVNDTQGHEIGDAVLREVANRFRLVLRHNELLARLGGDEFAVVSTATDHAGATFIAERLGQTLNEPLTSSGHTFSLGVSIGIAIFPNDGATPDELLRNADIAMYRAKSSPQRYMFYNADMSSGLAERIALARDLKAALQGDDGQLSLVFQPQFDLATQALIGAEALMRWQHPQHGPISPGVFIPIAEERGMMLMICHWVIDAACRQLLAWQSAGARFPGRMAINIAAQQMEDAAFPQWIEKRVRSFGLSPELFELELTESGVMRNIDLAIELAGQLSDAGFTLAIDDFGTGYSSLAYLKQLPADKLKIDQSFVRNMQDHPNDHAIVATIVAMGRTLGMSTIAEGIESDEQAAALRQLGCQEGQGYQFGHPESPETFASRWLG